MLFAIFLTLTLASLAYLVVALVRVLRFGWLREATATHARPVTVLKPVCGVDPELYDNLRSFCIQDYPAYQVIFGVRRSDDPALPILRRIIAELPGHDLTLVVDDRVVGSNFKISNLVNMHRLSKYDLIVIADSDMRVGPDYLAAVTAPFGDAGVGAVTCLYKGVAVSGFASRLGALFINDVFAPSVLVALSFQPLRFCLGATMAVTRTALDACGGLEHLAFQLADDHLLGKHIAARGWRVHLSRYVVEDRVFEPGFKALFAHELRWARTIRSVQPLGYTFSFLTYTLPLALLFWGIFPAHRLPLLLLALTALLRILLHYAIRACFGLDGRASLWLVPVRDLLCCAVWAASFVSRTVRWRDQDFSVRPGSGMKMKGKNKQ